MDIVMETCACNCCAAKPDKLSPEKFASPQQGDRQRGPRVMAILSLDLIAVRVCGAACHVKVYFRMVGDSFAG